MYPELRSMIIIDGEVFEVIEHTDDGKITIFGGRDSDVMTISIPPIYKVIYHMETILNEEL